MRRLLVTAMLVCASTGVAFRVEAEVLTVIAPQAELHGRPTLGSVVTGLVRRGETMEVLRSSSDRRWVQVEIGGGELAWIEARALKRGAVAPVAEREHTLITPRDRLARADLTDDARRNENEDDDRRRVESRRDDPPPPPVKREPPREVRNDPPPPTPVVREPVLQTSKPLRDLPAAKPGELYAADLDDERPPSGPAAQKRSK